MRDRWKWGGAPGVTPEPGNNGRDYQRAAAIGWWAIAIVRRSRWDWAPWNGRTEQEPDHRHSDDDHIDDHLNFLPERPAPPPVHCHYPKVAREFAASDDFMAAAAQRSEID